MEGEVGADFAQRVLFYEVDALAGEAGDGGDGGAGFAPAEGEGWEAGCVPEFGDGEEGDGDGLLQVVRFFVCFCHGQRSSRSVVGVSVVGVSAKGVKLPVGGVRMVMV